MSLDTKEKAAIFRLPVKVSKKLSLSKVSPLIMTRSTALYTIDRLSMNKTNNEKNIKYCKKILPINLAIE